MISSINFTLSYNILESKNKVPIYQCHYFDEHTKNFMVGRNYLDDWIMVIK